MKGKVTGHYVAIRPDEIVDEIKEGALTGFQMAESFDSNKRARVEAASTTGVVVDIGPDAFKTNDPDWKPWCKVGDRVWFVRHTAKTVSDEDEKDSDGNPRKIFVIVDENVIWNEGSADE